MCGFVIVKEEIKKLPDLMFGVDDELQAGHFRCFHKGLQIIRQKDGHNILDKAIWQFLLEPKDGQLKASKYTSFNSRWRGQFARSFTKPFKETRCIIPVSSFNEGMNKKYHNLSYADGSPILFGGLYKEYEWEGEIAVSASMITKPPTPRWKGIHEKAQPFILPEDKQLLDMWLDDGLTDTEVFIQYLEETKIERDFSVFKTKGFSSIESVGESFIL